MRSLRHALLVCSFLSLTATCNVSSAVGGYPPWGAWAYGSGTSVFGAGHWGGVYPTWGITTGYPTRLGVWGHAIHRRHAWYPRAAWAASSIRVPVLRSAYYPTYSTYAYVSPLVCAPTYAPMLPYEPQYPEAGYPEIGYPETGYPEAGYATPAYYLPVPTGAYYSPCYWPSDSVSYVAPLRETAPSFTSPIKADASISLSAHVFNGPLVGRLTAVETALPEANTSSEIPSPLLESADAILLAGGYRPAATAFAQLNVRYGSSHEIFTRRFIAQVACDDWDQAAVVLASAQAAGYHVTRSVLPNGTLASLLPGDFEEVARITERLAAEALRATDQREAMNLMGVWLELSGDDARAALFFTMADQLSREEPGVEFVAEPVVVEQLPTPRSKSAVLSLE